MTWFQRNKDGIFASIFGGIFLSLAFGFFNSIPPLGNLADAVGHFSAALIGAVCCTIAFVLWSRYALHRILAREIGQARELVQLLGSEVAIQTIRAATRSRDTRNAAISLQELSEIEKELPPETHVLILRPPTLSQNTPRDLTQLEEVMSANRAKGVSYLVFQRQGQEVVTRVDVAHRLLTDGCMPCVIN